MSTRLWLVRHGQIAANVSAHWHGSTDSPLTDAGEQQAARVADWFAQSGHPVGAIYTSPLGRTRATAEAIARALDLEPHPESSLREYGIGVLEGTHYRELHEHHRFFDRIREDPGYAPEGGESLAAVLERMQRALHDIAAAHRGEDVIVVGHGAATGLTLAHLLEADPLAWWRYQIRNCSVSELYLEPEPRLGLFNHTAHLE